MIIQCFSLVPASALSTESQPILAQDAPQYHIDLDWRMPDSRRADHFFHDASSELTSGAFDPLAQPLLESAEAFTRRIFQVPTLKFVRSVTSRGEGGDVILAEWTFNEPLKGFVILRDTPVAGNAPIRGFLETVITPRRSNEFLMHFAVLGAAASSDYFCRCVSGKDLRPATIQCHHISRSDFRLSPSWFQLGVPYVFGRNWAASYHLRLSSSATRLL